jgi:Flp pilus assembly protein TadB
MIQILAALAVLTAGSGIVLAIMFVVGTTRPAPPRSAFWASVRRMWQGQGRTLRQRRARQGVLILAVVAGAAAWLVTGWPVGGIIVALAIPGVPWLFAAATAEKRALARLSALEAWTRRVGDYVRNGIGLQAAIVASARTAPPLLAPEVRTLAARLQAGTGLEAALRLFADDIGDHSSDEVVAPLIMQSADGGEGLYHALLDIANGLAEEIVARATVDSERSSARFTVRFLTGTTVALLAFGALNSGYAAPYRTPLGQVILAVLAVFYVFLMLWIRGLTLPDRMPRLLSAQRRLSRAPDRAEVVTP